MTTEMTKYGSVDMAAIDEDEKEFMQEEAERKARRGFFSPKEGRSVVRAMPPWKATVRRPYKKVWLHKVRNPAEPTKPGASVPCPAKNFGKPCIICKKCQELRATGQKADGDAAYALSAQARYFMNVVNMEEPDAGVKLYEFGPRVYEQVFKLFKDMDYTSPTAGRNLIIERTGTGKMDTRYFLKLALKDSPIAKKEWLTKLPDLDGLVALMADDQMTAILEGRAEEFPPSDEEDEKPARSRSAEQDMEEDPLTGEYIPKAKKK